MADKKHDHPIDSGKIEEGGFHKWLGKSADEPITDEDIEKGLKSDDPHARKMAIFVKNSRKWKHKGAKKKLKPAHEGLPAWVDWANNTKQ